MDLARQGLHLPVPALASPIEQAMCSRVSVRLWVVQSSALSSSCRRGQPLGGAVTHTRMWLALPMMMS